MASRAGVPAMVARRRWQVYLIVCRSGAIYTGIAVDVDARYAQHVAGRGARYTRANPPVELLASFVCRDRGDALRLEYAIKQLTPSEKRSLARKTYGDIRTLLREA